MRNLLIVLDPAAWPRPSGDMEIVSSDAYLCDPSFAELRGAKVVNLCAPFAYQSVGYYVSLLAMARGHKVVPSVSATQDVKSRAFMRQVSEEITHNTKRHFQGATEDKQQIDVFFGRSPEVPEHRLAAALFGHLQIPLFRAKLRRRDDEWFIQSVFAMPASALDADTKERVVELAQEYFARGAPRRRSRTYRYDLAILHDPAEVDSPSNDRALARFRRAADALGMHAELIEKDDYRRLNEFDALFIRQTTAVNHHTYRFARRAESEGLVVIDDPDSILRCTNKVYLAERLDRAGVNHPKTLVVGKGTDLAAVERTLGFPCILKKPDGSFSRGTIRVGNADELAKGAAGLLTESELILAQAFVPTEFDWRIGILDGKPLFACRYYMAKNHWQVVKRVGSQTRMGEHTTMSIEEAPKYVVNTALRAAALMGDSLYGVDLKEINGAALVVEVNDNPNIDAGVEDQFLGPALYEIVMKTFLERIEAKKAKKAAPA